ncbi:uncharacterized protein LOC141659879 [Apium graveolens]|uniref:uncharacterized protein LOC141659879 n=1 Tax=Apium graveolens TaxID=4045 RepID=UPI003D7900D5
MRMLSYGVSADDVDDYVRIEEITAVECLKKFVSNSGDARGFSGMMRSIDCMYWQWKNCPKVWKGMFMSGHKGVATIILETVASSDLWIWHVFVGVAGSNNDINVLDRSPVFDDVLQGRAPDNMIVEDEKDTYATQFGPLPTYDDATNGLSEPNLDEEPFVPHETYIQISMQMRDKQIHRQLQNYLVEHIFQFHNNRFPLKMAVKYIAPLSSCSTNKFTSALTF